MNFGLLWIDALLLALLWVAMAAAWIGGLRRKWVRVTLLVLFSLLPVAIFGSFLASAAYMRATNIETNWFFYSLSLFLAYIFGNGLILWRAERRQPGLPPAAATWPRVLLAVVWIMSGAIGYMVLLNMDFAVRARFALLSVEVNSVYLATLPAINTDAQNAAPLYEKAFALLQDDQPGEMQVQNPPTGNNDIFDPNEPATITFLKDQAGTIALLRRAAALPACRFDQDLSDPDITQMMPGLNAERNAANVLRLDAKEEIAHGHAAPAIADAAAIIEMSRHLGQRPLIISTLIALGVDAQGNATLEEALPSVKSPDDLAALHLDDLSPMGRSLQQGLRGDERYALLYMGNMPAMDLAPGRSVPDSRLLPSGTGIRGAFFRVFFLDSDDYVQLLTTYQNLSIQPYYAIHDQLAALHDSKIARGLFTSILLPSLSRLFVTCARVEASDACAQVAVAMTRFRLDHGTLPSHLSDLVPTYLDAIPTDPFDGHPLRLAIKNNQWIIYSVGPDGVDDGGVPMVHDKGDVIFTLLPSPATILP